MKKGFIFFVLSILAAANFFGVYAMEGDFREEKKLIMPSLKEITADNFIENALKSEDFNSTQQQVGRLPEEVKEYVQYRIIKRPLGRTLLHDASTTGEIYQLIQGFSIDPLVTTVDGETPLMTFIRDGKRMQAFTMIDYLTKNGKGTDQKDMYGKTALGVARLFGDTELANRLLGHVQEKKQPVPSESILGRSAVSLKNFFVAKNNAQEDLVKDLFKQYVQQESILIGASFLQKLPKNISHAALAKEAAREDLYTCLTFMHRITNPEQVQLLVAIGADFNKTSKEGQNPLHTMIKTGNFNAACALLQCSQMINFDARDNKGMTPLCYALLAKHDVLIAMLLERGAKVISHFKLNKVKLNPWLLFLQPQCYTPELVPLLFAPDIVVTIDNLVRMEILYCALKSGYDDVVSSLLGDKNYTTFNDRGMTLAMYLVGKNHKKTFKKMFDPENIEQVDNQGNTIIFYALKDKVKILEYLIKNGANLNHQNNKGQTPLHFAFERSKEKTVRALLAHNPDLTIRDNQGDTALHVAVEKCPQSVDLLLNYHPLIDVRNNEGKTSLLVALETEQHAIAQKLINAGADVNAVDNQGQSVLHYVARYCSQDVVRYCPQVFYALVKKNARLDIADQQGKTPLHIAFETSNKVLAKYLMDADADVNAQDAQGRTPLMLCFQYQLIDFAEELLSKGANPDLLDGMGKDCLDYFEGPAGMCTHYADLVKKYRKK